MYFFSMISFIFGSFDSDGKGGEGSVFIPPFGSYDSEKRTNNT